MNICGPEVIFHNMCQVLGIIPWPNKHLMGLQYELAHNRKWAPGLYFGLHQNECIFEIKIYSLVI